MPLRTGRLPRSEAPEAFRALTDKVAKGKPWTWSPAPDGGAVIHWNDKGEGPCR